jgi:hypothetical protein
MNSQWDSTELQKDKNDKMDENGKIQKAEK